MAKRKRWIKLYPEGILAWEWLNYPGMLDFWVRLLVLADEKGEIVTTEAELARQCNTSRQHMRTMLTNLKSTKNITKTSTKGATKNATKITICNWDKYQSSQPSQQPTEQPSQQPAEQPKINQEEPSIPISSSSKSKHNEIEKKETPPKGGEKKEILFDVFMAWMAENAPTVYQLNQQAKPRYKFTPERFMALRTTYGSDALARIIKRMDNRKTLLKEYNSAWLTASNWLESDTATPAPRRASTQNNNGTVNEEWDEQ